MGQDFSLSKKGQNRCTLDGAYSSFVQNMNPPTTFQKYIYPSFFKTVNSFSYLARSLFLLSLVFVFFLLSFVPYFSFSIIHTAIFSLFFRIFTFLFLIPLLSLLLRFPFPMFHFLVVHINTNITSVITGLPFPFRSYILAMHLARKYADVCTWILFLACCCRKFIVKREKG